MKPNLSEQSRKSCVVCPGSEESHGEDRVVRNLGIRVVRKLAQRVEDVQLWVRDGDQTEGEGNRASDGRFAVSEEVTEVAEKHFRADVFAHRDQSQAEHGNGLL